MTYHAFTETSQASNDYIRDRSVPERLATVDKPVLVVFGAKDRRWDPVSAQDYQVIPHATIALIPGVGHSPMLENPRRTVDLLSDFAKARQPETGT